MKRMLQLLTLLVPSSAAPTAPTAKRSATPSAPAANFLCEIFLVTKGERPGLGARLRKPLAGERHLQAAGHHPRREKW